MKARRIISIILTVALVALLLAGCGEKSEADEYFKDFTQDGEILSFTVVEEVAVTGVSVFIDGTEYKPVHIEIKGSHKLANGTRISGTGSYTGSLPPVELSKNNKLFCTFDTDGNKPDKVCIYLNNGEILEKEL